MSSKEGCEDWEIDHSFTFPINSFKSSFIRVIIVQIKLSSNHVKLTSQFHFLDYNFAKILFNLNWEPMSGSKNSKGTTRQRMLSYRLTLTWQHNLLKFLNFQMISHLAIKELYQIECFLHGYFSYHVI